MRCLADGQAQPAELRRAVTVQMETPDRFITDSSDCTHGALEDVKDNHGGVIDDIDKVAARMLRRKSECDKSDACESDASESMKPAIAAKAKAKAKPAIAAKVMAKAKTAKVKTPVKATTPVKAKKTIEESFYKKSPGYSVERSRNQVMCRTGKVGAGQCHAIKFTKGGEKKAIEKAKEWVKAAMREYEKAGHKVSA